MDRRTFVQAAALAGVAALQTSHAAEAQVTAAATPEHPVTSVTTATDMTAEEVRAHLNLEPNATCGFVRETYVAKQKLAAGALPPPFEAERPIGSALYFMVTPSAPVKLHRIRNDQLYHYYLGDPLEVLLLRNGGEHVIVGPDLKAGHRVQLLIPGNTFHTARVIGTKRWFLGASTEWPGVIPADVEFGKPDELTVEFPQVAGDVRSFPEPVK
jgi:predicted cupin superfamily sugar epimerase